MTEHHSRRKFLTTSGTLFGGAWLASNLAIVKAIGAEAGSAHDAGVALVNFNAAEAATLGALADQIFPPDETPGAAAIGVLHFYDGAVDGFAAGALPAFQAGAADLDVRAAQVDSSITSFAELPFDQQSELVKEIEQGGFFNMILNFTLMGLFALPSYGGNRESLGWQLLGFESRHVWQPPFGAYDAAYAKGEKNASS